MSETGNVILAIVVVNVLAIGGIFYGLNSDEENLDTSTTITAKLVIGFGNLDDNNTMTFESVTTSESTVYGLLLAAQTQGNYSVSATTHYQFGLFIESIAGWGNCGGCQNEGGYWWTYFVNSENGQVAANRQIVNDGDTIKWLYTNEY
ncbi:MAG TPA: DUF4430 domain-containing protein [Marine Group III euryarchaeote]|jgi:hypothetical protein|uniref:DUF4430 domain-containing protein n=1 Tax=Marine Group III euryarchaeote TaxID=2173149 RepID=A0A7J4GW29_9ARCH|nr:DUF4430 domain-containing protein [Marine Group III euryarchaeote]